MRAAKIDMTGWVCAHCKCEKRATAHQMRQTYCSMGCMAAAYKLQMVGAANPNHKGAGFRLCAKCGCEYHSYNKTRVYCGSACAIASRPAAKPKVIKPPRPAAIKPQPKARQVRAEKPCIHCSSMFCFSPSQSRRLFCSYQCHLDSGGAFRAGIAASKATMKYGAKKDANHNELVEELRKHCGVFDLSAVGNGVPDGIAWINESWHLFDIKNPKTSYGRKGLNSVQKKWISQWSGGPVYLLYSIDDAISFGLGNFSNLKKEESAWTKSKLAA